jgi:uncharacterized membrane protein
MLAIRYTALLALVVWLGGMILLAVIVAPSTFQVLQAAAPATGRALAGSLFGTMLRHFNVVSYVCGFLMLVCLFAIKFLGPPPQSFIPRVAIVAAMLVVAVYSGYPVARAIGRVQAQVSGPISALPPTDARRVEFDRLHQTSTTLMAINVGLGLVLLFWYVRE